MEEILCTAFRGKGNSSNILVHEMDGQQIYLTNSYGGIKRDIQSMNHTYDRIYMFGLDKKLNNRIRIESKARVDSLELSSVLNLQELKKSLEETGIAVDIASTVDQTLCNTAYYYMLDKFHGNVVFIHIPSKKYITEDFISRTKKALF